MASPQPSTYRPDPAILDLGDAFYDAVTPAAFPAEILRFRNRRWDQAVGLGDLDDAAWLRHFARFEPLPDNFPQPLALRYHGHQFRTYNPDIGDGRGFLFAQLRDGAGRLLDLGTKGSGQTPYSRFGDGRLTLKGGMREVLATEMLEALGVETSKSFSLVETGEALERGDEPSPTRSAVLVRLQHSHIRIGTFQRLAYVEDAEAMARLVSFCLAQYYDDADGDAVALFGHVVRAAARLAASYIAAGFVHGVLNSDNIAITAESFDYGPWRFTPFWDGGFTAAYFDHSGLYAFARQPEAIHWNLAQLAGALRLVADGDALIEALQPFPALFQDALAAALLGRLGVNSRNRDEDDALLIALQTALGEQSVTIDRFFFDWRGGRRRGPSPADDAYCSPAFTAFADCVAAYETQGTAVHSYWAGPEPCSMHIEEVEAIWAAIDGSDDWQPFESKLAAIRAMGEAMTSPPPAAGEHKKAR